MRRQRAAPRWLLPITVGLLASGLAWVRWVDPTTWSFVDLGVYLRGGGDVLAGLDPYTAVSQHGLLFTYPPFASIAFVPLALLGPGLAPWVLTGISVLSYAAVVQVSILRAGEPQPDRAVRYAWLAVLLVGGVALEPVQRTLIFGQVNLLLAALVVVDVFLVPPRYRGLLVGLAAGIKLTPAVFLLLFLLKRDVASSLRAVAAGVATVVAAWVMLPGASWRYWSGGFAGMGKFGDYAVRPANQSLHACWVRLLGGRESVTLYVLSALVVLGLTVWAARRLLRSGDDLAALTVVAVGGLLVSPVSWTHHWVWAVPALVVMARRGWHVAVALVTAAMFLPPMWAVSADPLHLRPLQQVLASSYVLMGVAYLVVMAVTAPRALPVSRPLMPSRERDRQIADAR